MKSKKRIVLAYSGGLDTSIILKWLQENYDAEVICYTADIGQEINRKKIIYNARKFGVTKIIINDLKDIFVKDYVFPMIRGHAIYEGVYLLASGRRGQYELSGFNPYTRLYPTIVASSPETSADAPLTSEQFTIVELNYPEYVTTDALGNAVLYIHGALETSGNDAGMYFDTSYNALLDITINY